MVPGVPKSSIKPQLIGCFFRTWMLDCVQTFPSHPPEIGGQIGGQDATSNSRQGKGRRAGQAPRRAGFVFARDRFRVEIVAPQDHRRWTPPGNRSRRLARSEPCQRSQKGPCAPSGRSRGARSPIREAQGRCADIPGSSQAGVRSEQATMPTSEPHAARWWASLENHVFPVIGDMAVDRITQSDVLRCVEPIWTTRPEAARKVRQRIRTVLRWCQAHGYVHTNMAGEVIDGALPPMPRVQSHFRSLPYTEVADALALVDQSGASQSTKLCEVPPFSWRHAL